MLKIIEHEDANIIMSDEAHIHLNKQNFWYWTQENPCEVLRVNLASLACTFLRKMESPWL
jgi:hypothetical protein